MKQTSIIDNFENNTLLQALQKFLPETINIDIATGFFEIGSLLKLDGCWNNLEKMRIVMGDETTKRTKIELLEIARRGSNESIETAKEKDDALTGLLAIREALEQKQIEAKVYTKAKFHAKAFLMHMKPNQLSDYGVIGSSNFTEPGLLKNIELNLVTTEPNQLNSLQDWFEERWKEAEDVTDEIIKVIQPHIKLYSPFEIYLKALYEYFLGKEVPTSAWEETHSKIYKILDDLQKTGYRQALWIAENWGGAMICDGVGFGKSYIGLMLIERFLYERKRIALIVPLSVRKSVWESLLKRYLKYNPDEAFGQQIEIINHTDLHREGFQAKLQRVRELADVIIIDEAHHFRNKSTIRGKKLSELVEYNGRKKKLYMLTATPVNNSLFDILHLIEYFSREDRKYFQKIGINDTRSYFISKERAIDDKMGIRPMFDQESLFSDLNAQEVERILKNDVLFKAIIIQRSREFAKKYFERKGDRQIFFPEREPPEVVAYKLSDVYGDLFERIKESFNKENPFLDLLIYNTESKRKDESASDPFKKNREIQVISLIRATFLKRMESSYIAFQYSCEDLLRKMARFLKYYDEERWNEWKSNHTSLWSDLENHWKERFADFRGMEESDVEEDDILPDPDEDEIINKEEFLFDEILNSVENDLDALSDFLQFIYENINEETDRKLQSLISLLSRPELKEKKVIIFTEYRDTARYLFKQLSQNGFKENLEELDSTSSKDREDVIKRFAPIYNCAQDELPKYLDNQIRILVSTDVLSEGLNLQDSNYLINYDLHWNPVRLMQRIGRVDRRLDPEKEKTLDRHGCIIKFWNFLPPDELDSLLNLYEKVSGKVLRISKTLGIEGKQLLTPEDDFEALRDFNYTYNGVMSFEEKMRLIFEELKNAHPEISKELEFLPRRLFSGKVGDKSKLSGIFAAFRFPPQRIVNEKGFNEEVPGECKWYFFDRKNNEVIENIEKIFSLIESDLLTPRFVSKPVNELRKELKVIEQRCIDKELRNRQAAAGEKAVLVCWMEVN